MLCVFKCINSVYVLYVSVYEALQSAVRNIANMPNSLRGKPLADRVKMRNLCKIVTFIVNVFSTFLPVLVFNLTITCIIIDIDTCIGC